MKKRVTNGLAALLDAGLIFLVAYCAMYCFISGYEIDCNQKVFTGVVAALVIIFYITFSIKKGVEGLLLFEIVLYSIWSYQNRKDISNGLAIILNQVFSKISAYCGYKFGRYKVAAGNKEEQVTVFLLFLSVLFVGIVVYFMKKQKGTFFLLLLTLFFVFSPEYVGLVPGTKDYVGYAVGMLGFLGSRRLKIHRENHKSGTEKSIQGKIRVFQLFAGMACLLMAFFIMPEGKYEQITKERSLREAAQKMLQDNFNHFVKGYFYSGSVSGGIGFGELGQADEITYNKNVKLKLSVEEKNAENLEQIYLRGYIGSVYDANKWLGLSENDRARKEQLEKKSEVALEDYSSAAYYYVLSQEQFLEDSVFLSSAQKERIRKKGEFLEKYRYDTASDLMNQTSDQLLQTLKVENIGESFGTIFAPYGAVGPVEEKNGKLSAKNIKNKGEYSWQRAKQIWYYMPFQEGMLELGQGSDFLLEEEEYEEDMEWLQADDYLEADMWNKDGGTERKNPMDEFWQSLLEVKEDIEEEFNISIMNVDPDSLKRKSWWGYEASSYVKMLQNAINFYTRQQDYEAFVEDAYTQISKEQKEELLKQIDGYETYDGQWENIEYDIMLIRKYLNENTKYTLSPGKTPEGKDFVQYFLFDNKKGYCSHYASAATLMLRAMGVPARYVEGYVAKNVKLENGVHNNGQVLVNLTDENAHAWVEIYLKGYGWVPVEFTPGYGTSRQEKVTPKPEKTPEKTKAPNETTPPLAKSTLDIDETPEPIVTSENDRIDWTKWLPLLQGAGVLFLLGVSILGRRKLICHYRKRQEQNPDFSVRMAYYYRRIEGLVLTGSQRRKGRSLATDIEKGRIADVGVEDAKWQELLSRLNKYAFSEHGVSGEDVEWTSQLYQEVLGNIYKNKTILWKIYYKYIKVL